MKYYIIVTASSVPSADDMSDEALDLSMLDILSHDGQPLLFENQHDAEDFMDTAGVGPAIEREIDVEMVVIEAPESLDGIIVA